MIKIDYGKNRANLENDYYKLFEEQKRKFEKAVVVNQSWFNNVFKKEEFEKLLTGNFEELKHFADSIGKIDDKNIREQIKSIFKYEDLQPKIADFFQKKIQIDSCFYCNIENINAFSSFFKDIEDFLNNADEKELMTVSNLGPETAKKIIKKQKSNNRITFEYLKEINNKIKQDDIEDKLQDAYIRNSFTLDHVFEKSLYPYLALSLYNLVPSCYTCNSKLKGVSDEVHASPSSEEYKFFDKVKFKTFFTDKYFTEVDFNSKINDADKIELKLIDNTDDYNSLIRIFRLEARYRYHKDKVLEMVNKSVKYPPSMIKEIEQLTKQSEKEVKRDLFGQYLYENENSNHPFSKLYFDIAEELGLFKK